MLISCYRAIGDTEGSLDAARRTLAVAEKLVTPSLPTATSFGDHEGGLEAA